MDGSSRVCGNFLFLQGMASFFFAQLGQALTTTGHNVHRINFNGGDRVFWRRPGAIDYRGGLEDWPEFLATCLADWSITDIILFGDCRPLHRVAIQVAARRGIRVHVFEEGYLRPNWITLEQGGVNGHSSMPRDPAWFMETARGLQIPGAEQLTGGSFLRRATEDVLYNVATFLLAWRYPRYRTHRPWHPFVEYTGWLWRLLRQQTIAKRRTSEALRALKASGRPYFLFALQLDCDTQIRCHSPFGRLAPALEHVIASFARHSPADSLLVIKEHPLDNGLRNWRLLAQRIATDTKIADRIIYLEGGDLETLVERARGVVTVNSTVGTCALARGVPCIALGRAIYDMPGLTHQGGLDDFWCRGTSADPAIFDAFRRVLTTRYLVNGGFFSEEGIALAVSESVARLEGVAWSPLAKPLFTVQKNVRDRELGGISLTAPAE